jgi:hypothetical protein
MQGFFCFRAVPHRVAMPSNPTGTSLRCRRSADPQASPIGLARNFGFSAREVNTQSLVETNHTELLEAWNGILAVAADERVADVSFDQDALSVRLKDGRTISVPLAWYPRLFHAAAEQRRNWRLPEAATVSTGQKLTKTSAPKGCFRRKHRTRR